MIFTEDFFNPNSLYPAYELVQLIDSYTHENVNYKKFIPSISTTDDGIVYRKKGNDFYVDINFLTEKKLNILRFGAIGDNATDNTVAIGKALNFCRNYGKAITLFFPNGVYKFYDIGNIAIKDLTIKGESFRGVILKCLKEGIALNINAFENATNQTPFCQNMNLENLVIEGQQNTTVLIYVQGLARCNWENVAVREANKNEGIGFYLKGVQLSNFKNLQCSIDIDSMSNVPYQGLKIEYGHRNNIGVGNSSNNSFYDAKMEGLYFGINIVAGDQNVFYTGTSESCRNYGVMVGENCRYNTFIGTGFENPAAIADILDYGIHTIYMNCYASKKAWFQGMGATIIGGYWQEIQIDSSAVTTKIENITLRYFTPPSPSTGIIDNGKMTTIQNVKDIILNEFIPNKYNSTVFLSSTQRPQNNSVGSMIFDTTISKPIWWNGNNWIDATGNIV